MSANGMSRVFTPVVQAKGQQDSMNNMQNYSTGDNIRFPVTGARSFFIGGNRLPPQPRPPPQAVIPMPPGEVPASDGACSAAVAVLYQLPA
ncbi:unnamed protein product [Urochloa humidicola]